MSDLMSFYGESDGANTTGTFSLNSDWLESAVTSIKIPKGLAAKIWVYEQSQSAGRVLIMYSVDGGTNWSTKKKITLASTGHLEIDTRKPIMVAARNASTYLRFDWDQDSAAVMGIEVVIEFGEFE